MSTPIRSPRAPYGPQTKPLVHFDEDGMFTVFTGKHCSADGCGLQLTSRNRWGTAVLCADHGREKDRARVRKPKAAPQQTTGEPLTPSASPTLRPEQDPRRRELHSLFGLWVRRPTEERIHGHLMAAMRDYELKERLTQMSAPSIPQAIPADPLN